MNTKICSLCGVEKPLDAFQRAKAYKDGINARCRECRRKVCKEYSRAFRKARGAVPRKVFVSEEERQAAFKQNRKNWYLKNRARILAKLRQRSPEIHRRHCKTYEARYPERVRQSKQAYVQRHPERIKTALTNAKARSKGAAGQLTARHWKEILLFYGNRCALCYISAAERPLSVDHFIPISKGGNNTWRNVWPLCVPCNVKKLTSLPTLPAPPHVEAFERTLQEVL